MHVDIGNAYHLQTTRNLKRDTCRQGKRVFAGIIRIIDTSAVSHLIVSDLSGRGASFSA